MTSIRQSRWKPLIAGLSISLLLPRGCNPARSEDQQKVELRFAHATSAGTPKGLAADFFAEQVEEKSGAALPSALVLLAALALVTFVPFSSTAFVGRPADSGFSESPSSLFQSCIMH